MKKKLLTRLNFALGTAIVGLVGFSACNSHKIRHNNNAIEAMYGGPVPEDIIDKYGAPMPDPIDVDTVDVPENELINE